jgi:hypothetical protein
MCKMSTGVVALFMAGLVGVACGGQPGLTSDEGSGGNAGGAQGGQAGSTVDGGTAGGLGGTTGAGGVGAGETGGAGGGTGGTSGCPPIACPAFGCVGVTHLDPDPCGCPVCGPAPDAGPAKDAGGQDTRICLALPCAPPLCPGGYVTDPDPCGCPVCATDGGTVTDGGKKDAAPICPPINCPMLACTGGYVASPDPCGCPTCAPPDAGVAKDAGRADTKPVCLPVACPAIACVGGTHPNPDPCGCPLCGPAPDAGVAKDSAPPTACPMLASLNSTDAAAVSWGAGRMWLECKYTDGTIEDCLSNDATGCPGPVMIRADLVGCSDLCAANEYGLSYGGVGPLAPPPSIDLPAGCGSGLHTPAGVAFYCCPCGK